MAMDKTIPVMSIIITIVMVALGSTIGLAMQSKAGSVFTNMNPHTTAYGPYTEVVVAQQLTPLSTLTNLTEVDPASTLTSKVGEAFNVTTSYPILLTQVSFKLNKTGSPVGNLTAQLFALTGTYGASGKPTGSVIETSGKLAMATLSATSTWYNFTFAGTTRIEADTTYCVALVASEATTLNSTFYVSVVMSTNVYSGNSFAYTTSAYTTSTSDVAFSVYGLESAADIRALSLTDTYSQFSGVIYSSWPLLALIVLALIGSAVLFSIMLFR